MIPTPPPQPASPLRELIVDSEAAVPRLKIPAKKLALASRLFLNNEDAGSYRFVRRGSTDKTPILQAASLHV